MTSVQLLFGSNIEDRALNIRRAILAFVEEGLELLHSSNFYETDAWGKENQAAFLNVCVSFDTDLNPNELLSKIKQIEQKIGRQNRGKWEEREIDVDILYFGDQIVETNDLTIPHPKLIKRKFALVPLEEILPDKKHPFLKLNTTELIKLCTDTKQVTKLSFKPEVK